MQRKPKLPKMDWPEVTIIYVGDGRCDMTGARRNDAGEWLYSKWSYIPETELNQFLHPFLEAGFTVIDVRAAANLHTPGMGTATPILVIRPGVNPRDASQAATQLHQAILDLPDEP